MISLPLLLLSLAAACAAYIAGAYYQHRRDREERAMFQTALSHANRRIDLQRRISQNICEQIEDLREEYESHRAKTQVMHATQLDQMRRECEDQLLWAFRERNRAAARLANLERRGVRGWPVMVRSVYFTERSEN